MHNQMRAYLLARQPLCNIQFAAILASADTYVAGAGGIAADGFPVPFTGYLLGLALWDGATFHSDADQILLAAGDRISVYSDDTGADATVKVYKNGAASGLQITAIGRTATIQVVVTFTQLIE